MRQQHRRSVWKVLAKKSESRKIDPSTKRDTAGMWMAWMTPLENEESVVQFMSEHEIIPQGVFQVEI